MDLPEMYLTEGLEIVWWGTPDISYFIHVVLTEQGILISRFALPLGLLTDLEHILQPLFRESYIRICVHLYLRSQLPATRISLPGDILSIAGPSRATLPLPLTDDIYRSDYQSDSLAYCKVGWQRPRQAYPGLYCWCMVLAEKEKWIRNARDKCYSEIWILRVMQISLISRAWDHRFPW